MKVCLFLLAVGVFVGVASVVDGRSEKFAGMKFQKPKRKKKQTNPSAIAEEWHMRLTRMEKLENALMVARITSLNKTFASRARMEK